MGYLIVSDEDYFILDDGPLGSAYKIAQGTKILHKCNDWDFCILFIKRHMEKEQFWPNVWRESGHCGDLFPVTIPTKVA